MKPGWEPLLVGELGADAALIVDEVVAALTTRTPSPLPAFKGDGGILLLLCECDSPSLAPRLEHALAAATSAPLTLALFGGLSGMAWLLGHLVEGSESDVLLEHFDAALWARVDVPELQDRKDLMSGLAGMGVMLAARTDARARQLAERILVHFERTAIECSSGVTWRNEPQFLPEWERARFPDGMIDLGVAHGVPGIIGMLARFVEAGIEPERSRGLLTGAIAWLLEGAPESCPRFGKLASGREVQASRLVLRRYRRSGGAAAREPGAPIEPARGGGGPLATRSRPDSRRARCTRCLLLSRCRWFCARVQCRVPAHRRKQAPRTCNEVAEAAHPHAVARPRNRRVSIVPAFPQSALGGRSDAGEWGCRYRSRAASGNQRTRTKLASTLPHLKHRAGLPSGAYRGPHRRHIRAARGSHQPQLEREGSRVLIGIVLHLNDASMLQAY